MNEVMIIKFLHLLGFAYWLGADLAVFYSSYYVANEKLSPEVRTTTAKILFALDQVPRMCMTMMLPLGITLAWQMHWLPFPVSIVVLAWFVSAAWLAMVIYLHAAKPGAGKTLLTRFDFWFRLVMALSLICAGAAGSPECGSRLISSPGSSPYSAG